jgi:heme exporter protein B
MKLLELDTYSLYRSFFSQFKVEMLMRWRKKSDLFQPVVFFMMIMCLFPLAVNVPKHTLTLLAPGIIWVVLLLGSLLSCESLFREDYYDGSLLSVSLSPQPLWLYVIAKISVLCIAVIIPLMLTVPVLVLMYSMPVSVIPILMLSVIIGGLSLCLIGAIGAALTVSIDQKSLLTGLLVLPLYIPVLIFASSMVSMSIDGHSVQFNVLILASFSLFSMIIAPVSITYALKLSLLGR